MEFGRVSPDELDAIDFKLPAEPRDNERVIKKASSKNPQVFIGCAKWGRKDWIGKIYPDGTKEADFLSHYAKHFNCIELNATFYRIPTASQTKGWSKKVGKDFKFCPKITGQITHMKRLKDVQEITDKFLQGISGFGQNLGPVFVMPHPGMGPKSLPVLESFIKSFPKDIRLFLELRHPEWYSDNDAFKKLFEMMESTNTGSIITDASGRRDCTHMRLSTPEAFIRFVGNGLHATDYTRVDEWVQRIKLWLSQGISQVYFFMHQHEEIHSPELCKYVIEQLNKECGLSISVPQFVNS
jgi:uncharacterized protein YecE (DUF72 family)